MKIWIIAVLIVATIIAMPSGSSGHSDPIAVSHPVMLVQIDNSSPIQNISSNYSYIGIHLLSHITLYGENYIVQANSSGSTVIVPDNSAEVYSQGLNRLTVEYNGADQFTPVLFTDHINKNFTLKNLTGTQIIINDYSYRLNRSFTVVYSVQVMTLSNYRSYMSNHLTPPSEVFSYANMLLFTEYNGAWILSMLVILTLVIFTILSEKSEHDSDISLLE